MHLDSFAIPVSAAQVTGIVCVLASSPTMHTSLHAFCVSSGPGPCLARMLCRKVPRSIAKMSQTKVSKMHISFVRSFSVVCAICRLFTSLPSSARTFWRLSVIPSAGCGLASSILSVNPGVFPKYWYRDSNKEKRPLTVLPDDQAG